MDLQDIRDQLINELSSDINLWSDVLDNTTPGSYGLNDWEINVPEDGFYVDIPNRTFTFKDVGFTADLILGASKGDASFNQTYSKIANGKGIFDFVSSKKVRIKGIDVDIDLNIF